MNKMFGLTSSGYRRLHQPVEQVGVEVEGEDGAVDEAVEAFADDQTTSSSSNNFNCAAVVAAVVEAIVKAKRMCQQLCDQCFNG